jgi:uncharacterized protein YndB with AHSA1/START domain
MADGRTDRTDSVSRLIQARAEGLYAAFRDADTLMAWLPPANMTGRALEYEFRVGGRYRIELRYRDGVHQAGKTSNDSDISKGRFIELVAEQRIRQTVEFESEEGGVGSGMTMTWTFVAAGTATEVTVTAERVPAAIDRADHLKGLDSSLDNLARFAERSR